MPARLLSPFEGMHMHTLLYCMSVHLRVFPGWLQRSLLRCHVRHIRYSRPFLFPPSCTQDSQNMNPE